MNDFDPFPGSFPLVETTAYRVNFLVFAENNQRDPVGKNQKIGHASFTGNNIDGRIFFINQKLQTGF